jgi:hypothetical protein
MTFGSRAIFAFWGVSSRSCSPGWSGVWQRIARIRHVLADWWHRRAGLRTPPRPSGGGRNPDPAIGVSGGMGISCDSGQCDELISTSNGRWDGSKLSLNSMRLWLPSVHGDPVSVWFHGDGFSPVADPVHEALHVGNAVCDVGDVEGLDGWFEEGAGHEHDGL